MINSETKTNVVRPARTRQQARTVYLPFDVPLVLVTIMLLIFGLLILYSASTDYSIRVLGEKADFIFNNQLRSLVIALGVAGVMMMLDYHYWRRLVLPGMAAIFLALLAVLVFGDDRLGSTRTFLQGSYMPSEPAKIITILYLSVWLYSKRNYLDQVSFGLLPLAGIIGVISGLILLQPDLSAAATIVMLGGLLFFLAGGDLRQIALLLVVTVLVGWLVVQIHPTGNERFADYRNSIEDPTQASYHVQRSLGAFISGGFFGRGLGLGGAKYTGLPLPPTDSIFAVVAQETGLIGAGFMILLYAVLVWRGLVIAFRAPDMLGSLIAGGMSLWLALEAFMNMAVMVNLLPFAGNALPFVSAGGSNLVVSMMAIGILMNISRLSNKQPEEKGNTQNATVGVRRSDGRGRVSRTRRTASARRTRR
jgi:cell division protein FtsW